jgi:hypothetical protein
MWVTNTILGDGVRNGFRDNQLDRLWMTFGFHGGVPVVDAVVDIFYSSWRPGEPATIGVYFRDGCQIPLEMQAVIAAYSIPVTEETNRKSQEIHARLPEIEAMMRPGQAKAAMDQLRRDTVRLWHSSRSKVDDIGLPLPEKPFVEPARIGKEPLPLSDDLVTDSDHPSPDVGQTATSVPAGIGFSREGEVLT